MAAKRNIPEAWKNQWSKFMFNFFDSWTQEGSRGSRGDVQETTVAAGGTQANKDEQRRIRTDGAVDRRFAE